MHLKILSYNIHKGRSAMGLSYLLDDIKQAVHDTGADVVFLQEIHGFGKSSKTTEQTSEPLEFIADTVWDHYRYGKNAVYPKGHHGNATLSKYPIVHYQNTDISQTPFAKRGLLHTVVHIPDHIEALHLINVHLDLFESSRMKQYEIISEYIKTQIPANAPIILAGDFNDWRKKANGFFERQTQLKEAYYEAQSEFVNTYPSYLPMFALDRVYFRGLDLTHAETPSTANWAKLSDHVPLLVSFHL